MYIVLVHLSSLFSTFRVVRLSHWIEHRNKSRWIKDYVNIILLLSATVSVFTFEHVMADLQLVHLAKWFYSLTAGCITSNLSSCLIFYVKLRTISKMDVDCEFEAEGNV